MPKSLSADIKNDIKSALLARKDSIDVVNRFGVTYATVNNYANKFFPNRQRGLGDDWRRVVFSDETKVNVWGSDGCKYYWSRPEDPLKPHHIDVTVKHGGGSLMMWGCMTHEGPGKVKLSQACAFEQFFQLNAFYNDNIIDLSDVTNTA
ncbi:hypothetical protein G6F62_012759 [Rhizopus arrhizus]|nr:hypothetical protein G6F62_012759 [Rhizopus arrhizus]